MECCICLEALTLKWKCNVCEEGAICCACYERLEDFRRCPVCRSPTRVIIMPIAIIPVQPDHVTIDVIRRNQQYLLRRQHEIGTCAKIAVALVCSGFVSALSYGVGVVAYWSNGIQPPPDSPVLVAVIGAFLILSAIVVLRIIICMIVSHRNP